MPYKNTAVTFQFIAWDTANNVGKTGDAANITLRGVGDGTEFTPSAPSITQIDATNLKGIYKASLTAGENNYSMVTVGGVSTTANIVIIPVSWSNEIAADIKKWLANAVTANVSGVPKVDTAYWLGTACATPTNNGVPEVDVTHWLGVATSALAADTDIADAVCDEALSGHTTAGTLGKAITDIEVDTGTTLDGKIDTIDTNVDSILADTGTDGVVVAAASKTGYSLAADQSGVTVGTVSSVTALGAGAVDAAAIATGAIDADALAADAGTEIGTAVWASAARTLTSASAFQVKKNTELAAFPFVMTDDTNHAPLTSLSVTATRSIDGAAFGACANAVAEIGNGWYKITLAAADLNGTTIALRFTGTNADDLNITIVTQS